MKDINILWFKKDLRIDDNEALYESLKNNDILPIYIFEIDLWFNEEELCEWETSDSTWRSEN